MGLLRLPRSIAGPSSYCITQRALHTTRVAREQFLNADSEAFKKWALDVNASKPILVDFFATWCQPCRVLTPTLISLTGPQSGFDLMTIDVDENPDVAAEFKVSALPTVVAFKAGKPANKFVGVLREQQVKTFMEKL